MGCIIIRKKPTRKTTGIPTKVEKKSEKLGNMSYLFYYLHGKMKIGCTISIDPEEEIGLSYNSFFNLDGFDSFEGDQPGLAIEMEKNERLLCIVLEMDDEDGLIDPEVSEDFDTEPFIEQQFFVREREFESFVKVLHYNQMRYRVTTLR